MKFYCFPHGVINFYYISPPSNWWLIRPKTRRCSSLFLFSLRRIVDSLSTAVRSSTTRECRIARRIITPSVARFVPVVPSPSLVDASPRCSANFTLNISFAHFAWSNWTKVKIQTTQLECLINDFFISCPSAGTFKEQNDKPYCHGCFDKLFG